MGQKLNSNCVSITRASRKRTAAALRQAKRSNSDMAAPGTSPRSLGATRKPSKTACGSSSNCPMILQLPDDPAGNRVRKPGGGRKKAEAKHPELIQQVQHTIKDRTAGDP